MRAMMRERLATNHGVVSRSVGLIPGAAAIIFDGAVQPRWPCSLPVGGIASANRKKNWWATSSVSAPNVAVESRAAAALRV
jgi:hypothetical protein